MDMHETMAIIHKFKNAKSVNMENSQNINPVKIIVHTVSKSYNRKSVHQCAHLTLAISFPLL